MKDIWMKGSPRDHLANGNHLGNDLPMDMFLRNEQAGLCLRIPLGARPGRSSCRGGIRSWAEMVEPFIQFHWYIGTGLGTAIRAGSGQAEISIQTGIQHDS
jgi:hypothetical protein